MLRYDISRTATLIIVDFSGRGAAGAGQTPVPKASQRWAANAGSCAVSGW
jgi:hypothetical protein